MRTIILLLLFYIGPVNAYSCIPPKLGVLSKDDCNPKYFTLPQMEDAISSLKGLTEEGKDFIYEELLKKRTQTYFTVSLKVFTEELCQKSTNQGIDLFDNGSCPKELLSYSLIPGGDIFKLEGSIDIEITIGPDGKPNGGSIRGGVKF